MEYWILILIVGILHFVDMTFTIGYLIKSKKRFKNPEELEFNFHKYFFKKFGIMYGGFISFFISFPLMLIGITFIYLTNNIFMLGFILGVMFNVAIYNFQVYMSYDYMFKKLKRVKENKTRM